jgi:hypothetical protein
MPFASQHKCSLLEPMPDLASASGTGPFAGPAMKVGAPRPDFRTWDSKNLNTSSHVIQSAAKDLQLF